MAEGRFLGRAFRGFHGSRWFRGEEPSQENGPVINLTVTRLREEEGGPDDGARREEEARRGCEGIQFPSSRGWRAAHTLPFGAVTPRELWSPNEWLGRAKRRITYFFFSRFSALFQDVYKYGDRTCLPGDTSSLLVPAASFAVG